MAILTYMLLGFVLGVITATLVLYFLAKSIAERKPEQKPTIIPPAQMAQLAALMIDELRQEKKG